MAYVDELKAKIKALEQSDELKEMEIYSFRLELQELTKPSVEMTEITYIVSLMLMENVAFVKKNGYTAKAKESRERLLKLLHATELFNSITMTNVTLKLINRDLIAKNIILMAETADMKKQIDKVNKTFQEI